MATTAFWVRLMMSGEIAMAALRAPGMSAAMIDIAALADLARNLAGRSFRTRPNNIRLPARGFSTPRLS